MTCTALRPVHSFGMRAMSRPPAESPQSELLDDGRPTGISVPGVVLEAQYTCGEWHLLFTTEDVPFEEALHILLLDRQLHRLDDVELSHLYAAGALTGLETSGDEPAARFSFFGGDRWELRVLSAPRRLSRSEAPVGVKARVSRMLTPKYLALSRLL